ncbi:MAG: hypothetical protein ACOWWR_18480 [Eubacteriales bacterium]
MTMQKALAQGWGNGKLYDVIKWVDGAPVNAEITVGVEDTNVINVSIQLKDWDGKDLANPASVTAYLASDSAGLNVVTTTVTTETAIGTDGSLGIILAKTMYLLTSESDGDIDLDFTDTGTNGFYLVLVMANGKLVVSDKIEFAGE